MISEFGYDYEIFEKIGFLPIEVQRLIDIFSINHNILLRNGFMKDDFMRELRVNGVVSETTSEYPGSLHDMDIQTVDDSIPHGMLGRYNVISTDVQTSSIPELSSVSGNIEEMYRKDMFQAYHLNYGNDTGGFLMCRNGKAFLYSDEKAISSENYSTVGICQGFLPDPLSSVPQDFQFI